MSRTVNKRPSTAFYHPDIIKPLINFNTDNQLLNNLDVTTITINGLLTGIEYKQTLDKDENGEYIYDFYKAIKMTCHNDEKYIYSYTSGEIAPVEKEFKNEHLEKYIKAIYNNKYRMSNSNKGRKSKDKDETSCFHSQNTVKIISKKYSTDKIYNIKIFRHGEIGLPGVYDMEDAIDSLVYWINTINNTNCIQTNVDNLYISMINYKTSFDMNIISLAKLNQQLVANGISSSYDKCESTNCISIKVKYDPVYEFERHRDINFLKDVCNKFEELNTADIIAFKANTDNTYRIEIYSTGKIGFKGNCPILNVVDILNKIWEVLVNFKEVEYNNKTQDINEFLNNLPHDKVIY